MCRINTSLVFIFFANAKMRKTIGGKTKRTKLGELKNE